MEDTTSKHLALQHEVGDFIEALKEDVNCNPLFDLVYSMRPSTVEPRVGQLWTALSTKRPGHGTLVLLTYVDGESLRAVNVFRETCIAATDDVWIPEDSSPLPYPLIASTWTDTPLLKGHLFNIMGEVSDDTMEPLLMVLQNNLTGGFRAKAVAATLSQSTEDPDVEWAIAPNNRPDLKYGYSTGRRILDDNDPRNEARNLITKRVSWLASEAIDADRAEAM